MKKSGWIFGSIIIWALCLAVIALTVLNLLPKKEKLEYELSREQAVMLAKNACDLHHAAVSYTNIVLNIDADTTTYEEWKQNIDKTINMWNDIGSIAVALEYNDGIKTKPSHPIFDLLDAVPLFNTRWQVGVGAENLADRLSAFGFMMDSDRGKAYTIIKEAQQTITPEDWDADNERIAALKRSLAVLREAYVIQHASTSERDIDVAKLEIYGADAVIFMSNDEAFVASDTRIIQDLVVNINKHANIMEETENNQYEIIFSDVLLLRTESLSTPGFLIKRTDELFKNPVEIGQSLKIDIADEMRDTGLADSALVDIGVESTTVHKTAQENEFKEIEAAFKWSLDRIEYEGREYRIEDSDYYDSTYIETETSYYFSNVFLKDIGDYLAGDEVTHYVEWTMIEESYSAGQQVDITMKGQVSGRDEFLDVLFLYNYAPEGVFDENISGYSVPIYDYLPKDISNDLFEWGRLAISAQDGMAEVYYTLEFPDSEINDNSIFEVIIDTDGFVKHYYYMSVPID